MAAPAVPNVTTIAGVDPSGGAGVLADVKAISANGAYACGVIAALTAQSTQGVTGIQPVPPDFVRLQIDTLFSDLAIAAVKIGMLGQRAVTQVVADRLAHWKPATCVLDPVMIAKSGDALLDRDGVGALREALLPLATMLTPNLPEAGVLLEQRPPETLSEMRRAAERLREAMAHDGQRWVYLKGGHLPGSTAIDLLHDGDRMIELAAPRIDTKNTHGTGCTLSSALAALIAQTPDVPAAARRAKDYLTGAIRVSGQLDAGMGHGPVHHFWQLWPAATRA